MVNVTLYTSNTKYVEASNILFGECSIVARYKDRYSDYLPLYAIKTPV
jgi:hypothetical protein